jgi:hypothetical protein
MGSFDWRPDDHGDGSSGHADLKKDQENRPHGTWQVLKWWYQEIVIKDDLC